jgi:catechol 2,3-dioxygenase-like lactoylglutathione lyase family enzyme
MQPAISLITILTNDVPAMVSFYRDVLRFQVRDDRGNYVEFANKGVRFAICARSIMARATGSPAFDEPRRGQSFELAFPCDSPEAVDQSYADIIANGARPVKAPATMPWNQRTAFFADPEGNIHELFAELPPAKM